MDDPVYFCEKESLGSSLIDRTALWQAISQKRSYELLSETIDITITHNKHKQCQGVVYSQKHLSVLLALHTDENV